MRATLRSDRRQSCETAVQRLCLLENICDWPTDKTISVQPDGDSWKVKVPELRP